MEAENLNKPQEQPENSMAQANANYDRWKDARDIDKAFEEWVKITPDEKTSDWPRLTKAFALYYAQRCGVVLDGNSEIPNNHKCDHPYHSVVGGNGSPERCLTCGKVLSI